MSVDAYLGQQLSTAIKAADFKKVFNLIGWDNPDRKQPYVVQLKDGTTYQLTPVARKRSLPVLVCPPAADGRIPPIGIRKQIEIVLTEKVYEHLIIFVDEEQQNQVWQGVLHREHKMPVYNEYPYHAGQTGQAIIEWLLQLVFLLEEEELLGDSDITDRVTRSLAVERVTKQFYEGFKHEHSKFLAEIKSSKMTEKADLEWYASVMLNRLMFVYFIQKKGFLDGNADYLRERLGKVQQRVGDDKFLSFYRHFLLRLFHNYLNKPTAQRFGSSQFDDLIGNVPYLNGGIFDEHELEKRFDDIQIADAAFTAVFDFFDQYRWHLDERANRDDREINPDVLGYIFEKYINQKQMGAYYTKEDITGYIAKSTIIPFLFDKAAAGSAISFALGSTTWRLLTDNPDRYIYAAVRSDERLPTETSREFKARRDRYADLRARLVAGEVTTINDLITHNLDILQFADDAISGSDSSDLLRAFYKAMAGDGKDQPGISVLDPTCGSGAFLFAALNILVRLYEACLIRMEGFIAEAERNDPVKAVGRYPDFRAVLKQRDQHANPRYFVLKSIIIGNLFGVDIMEEAVEIAKLRLFLKLAAQVEYAPAAPNMGLEPLPDVDFNIKAGNTLVGYVSLDEVRRAMTEEAKGQQTQRRMLEPEQQAELERIEEQARLADVAYRQFRRQQTELGGNVTAEDKANLRGRLARLDKDLDRLLVKQYGQEADFDNWRTRHQPFHWLTQFHGIMSAGGFDVIIGNPPYVEYYAHTFAYRLKGYETLVCANLYTCMVERCSSLLKDAGFHSMILPLSGFATKNMIPFIEGFQSWFGNTWLSFYHFRPSMLFSGGKVASIPTAVFVAQRQGSARHSTGVNKWATDDRDSLFSMLTYANIDVERDQDNRHYYPKFSSDLENSIMRKVASHGLISRYLSKSASDNSMFYRSAGGLYWKVFINYAWPYVTTTNKKCFFQKQYSRDIFVALFSSSLFWWYYTTTFDTFHLQGYMLFGFRFSYPTDTGMVRELEALCAELMSSYKDNAKHLLRGGTGSYTVYAKKAKPIIDEIDIVLARHYGLTDEELDFIINYDIKYRMGKDAEEEEE